MPLTDPIADMLTRIRNAIAARHDRVAVPASKIKLAIAAVLAEEGFIKGYQLTQSRLSPSEEIDIELLYKEQGDATLHGLKRISRPGLRVYVQQREIPRVYGGLGIAILSTPRGVMTGHRARRERIGGEILCYVW